MNQNEEPVSVGWLAYPQGNGEGFGADPGSSDQVLLSAPGNVDPTCAPLSQITAGEEPVAVRLMVVDPEGLYVDGTLACENVAHMIADFTDLPVDEGPPPLDVARTVIDGLRDEDVLRYGGYPEQPRRAVVVARGGEVVASFTIARFEGRSWEITEYRACEGSDLPSQAA